MTFHPQILGEVFLDVLCFFPGTNRIEFLVVSRAKTQTKFLDESIPLIPFFMLPETDLRWMAALTNVKTRKTPFEIWVLKTKLAGLQNRIV
jgi:hypothetical protein